MTLEYQVDSIENLEEAIKPLYKEQDGKYVLDVAGHEKNADKNKIPKARLDAEIAKRKTAEESLHTVAEALKSDIPEEFQNLIPELPAAQMIAWIQKATSSGLFDSKESTPIDNKKPGSKPAVDLDSLSSHTKMSMGYKK